MEIKFSSGEIDGDIQQIDFAYAIYACYILSFCSINCKQRPQYKSMKSFGQPAESGKLKHLLLELK